MRVGDLTFGQTIEKVKIVKFFIESFSKDVEIIGVTDEHAFSCFDTSANLLEYQTFDVLGGIPLDEWMQTLIPYKKIPRFDESKRLCRWLDANGFSKKFVTGFSPQDVANKAVLSICLSGEGEFAGANIYFKR